MYPEPEEETLISALNLWDDLWLKHNILSRVKTMKSPKLIYIFHPIDGKGDAVAAAAADVRALQRTPSLPRQQADDSESSVTCKISTRKLRHSCSSLDDRKHSSYYSKKTTLTTTPDRHRPPRRSKLDGSKSDFIIRQMSFRKVFDEKKCKSLSDLEYLEVQGFKDLGFDFSKGLNASLMKMIPGLRDQGDEEKNVRRPYLSEAWSLPRPTPPVVRWSGRQSAEDMKEQLKFWARNVACNVKQEC